MSGAGAPQFVVPLYLQLSKVCRRTWLQSCCCDMTPLRCGFQAFQADMSTLEQGLVHGVPAYDITQIQSWINALGPNSAALSNFQSQGTILMPSSLTHQQAMESRAAAGGEPRASPPFQGTGPPPVLHTGSIRRDGGSVRCSSRAGFLTVHV